jgi:cytochrome c oxidase subunit II
MIRTSLTAFAALASEPKLPKLPDSPFCWMPPQVSTIAAASDFLYEAMLWGSVVCAAAIFYAIWRFCTKYRAKSRAANEVAAKSTEHNTALEITWSVIPLFIVIALFVGGFKGFVDIRTPPKGALALRATGQKWKWLFSYPGVLASPQDELHVPVNTNVRVVINSVDVLHSLYLPVLRLKMDAVPGRYTDLWFKATQTGDFPIFCAEYCGTSHSDMLSHLVVQPQAEYDRWIEIMKAKDNKPVGAERGQDVYEKRGCATCHTTDGTPKIGPSWKGIWGKTENMTGGPPITVDENYIRESIMDPQAKIVAGFAPSMPTFKGQLSDADVDSVIEYIKTLK